MSAKVKKNQVGPETSETTSNRPASKSVGSELKSDSSKPIDKKKRTQSSSRKGEESSDPPASLGIDKSMRVDAKGNVIVKGGKKHRISFKPDIAQVIHVESYKEYNMESYNPSNTGCSCNLF